MFAATMNGLLSLGISSQEDHSVSFTGTIIGSHPANAPGIRSTLAVEDRANTSLDMTRLAAALAVYRAENGRYPQTLGDLVSGVLAKPPADSFKALLFVYKPDADGYLLYSMGENGQDDGGSSRSFRNPYGVFEGRSLAGLKGAELGARSGKIPAGADDVSLRLPRPPFDWNELLSPK
jgi:hypothetical protein